MPIEIKELHIRVAVNGSSTAPQAGSKSPAAGSGNAAGGGNPDTLVSECVEKVLQVLQNKTER